MKALSRKLLSLLLSCTLLLTLAPAALASEALGDDLDLRSTTLSRGTELGEGTFWSNAFSDLRQENYIVYTPNTGVTPIVTYGDYTTATSTVSAAAKALEAQGLRVVAGVNGDYYDTLNGAPLGTVMTDGVLRVASTSYYAIGFRADGSSILGAPTLRLTAQSGETVFPLAAVNQVRYSYGGIYLYTHDFNARRSTGTNAAGLDVVCSAAEGRLSIGDTLTLTVDEILPEATDTVIGEGKYVLTANLLSGEENLAPLRALSVGDTLTVSISAADEGWNDVDYMIGALYQLVENGAVCAGLAAGAAPRTAIGQRADGSLVLYTIDGRQKGYSVGASLTQVAQRMVELGCVSALSLDGGGSTTLCVTLPESSSAEVYNIPSEGSLRAVTNHIFLVAPSAASGTLDHISLRAERYHVLAGARVKLYGAAVDTNYLPMSTTLSYASDRGSVSQDEAGVTLTAPTSAGTVTVGAKAGGKHATAELRVIASPDSIKLGKNGTLTELRVAPGQSVDLSVQAYKDHLPLLAQNDCFSWSVDGGVGTVDANGKLTAADRAAYGSLTVKAGDTTLTVPVYVTSDPLVLLDGFESEQSVFTQNTDKSFVRFGAASAHWSYAAEQAPGGVQETVLTVEQSYTLPSGYECVTLWVYGDGQGERLALMTDAGETNAAAIDFTGWQQLTFPLPSKATSVIGFALHAPSALRGTLYLDQLVAAHEGMSDAAAPELTLALSEDGAALTGKVFDAVDGAKLPTLRVTLDGKSLSYTYDHQTGALRAALPAADGKAHRVAVVAGDASGNLARAGIDLVPQELGAAFGDTLEHWSNPAVSFLKANGVTNGDDQGNFNPDSPISRQEFAALLCRWLAPAQDFSAVELPFADNGDISDWAKDSVRAMYALGVTNGGYDGYGRPCFSPKATISRQEALTMLGRLLELGYASPAWNFTDSDAIADWARGHINTLCAIGAISGYADGGIHPTEPITRAQVAAILFSMT